MIQVLALTQFAFLALGIMSLVVRARANGRLSEEILGVSAWWLVVIPLIWIAFALLCSRVQKAPLSPGVARVTGVILAFFSFLFMVAVTFSN